MEVPTRLRLPSERRTYYLRDSIIRGSLVGDIFGADLVRYGMNTKGLIQTASVDHGLKATSDEEHFYTVAVNFAINLLKLFHSIAAEGRQASDRAPLIMTKEQTGIAPFADRKPHTFFGDNL